VQRAMGIGSTSSVATIQDGLAIMKLFMNGCEQPSNQEILTSSQTRESSPRRAGGGQIQPTYEAVG
jgi:hypothetical protein